MSEGRHRGRRSGGGIGVAACVLAVPASILLGVAAALEAFRYSPYENPGALTAAVWLGLGAVLFAGIPVLYAAARGAVMLHRARSAWMQKLTPRERAAVRLGEFVGLSAVHVAWRDHNRREGERLTESVMGSVPKLPGEDG